MIKVNKWWRCFFPHISTLSTFMPHGSVASSSIFWKKKKFQDVSLFRIFDEAGFWKMAFQDAFAHFHSRFVCLHNFRASGIFHLICWKESFTHLHVWKFHLLKVSPIGMTERFTHWKFHPLSWLKVSHTESLTHLHG